MASKSKTFIYMGLATLILIVFMCWSHDSIGQRNARWQREISDKNIKEYRLYEIKDSMDRFRDEIPDSEYNNLIKKLK